MFNWHHLGLVVLSIGLGACTGGFARAGTSSPCQLRAQRLDAAAHPVLRDAASRFLASTTDITKTFITQSAYEQLGGLVLLYSPSLDISLKQPWMRVPMPLAVRELRVLGSGPALRSWVLKADGSIIELRGGQPELLSIGAKSLLCGRGSDPFL